MKVSIVQIDPYHKIYGKLVPWLADRLDESLQALGDETGMVLANFMAMLWGRSPDVLLLAAVDAKGVVKGHLAALYQDGKVVFSQPKLDEPTENDAIAEMLEALEKWARSKQATVLLLVSRRYDAKFTKKHGYEVARYMLSKALS